VTAAASHAADKPGFLPGTALSHFYPGPQFPGQIFYQFAEINPVISGEVKNDPATVKQVLNPGKFHREFAGFDSSLAESCGPEFPVFIPFIHEQIAFSSFPEDLPEVFFGQLFYGVDGGDRS